MITTKRAVEFLEREIQEYGSKKMPGGRIEEYPLNKPIIDICKGIIVLLKNGDKYKKLYFKSKKKKLKNKFMGQ